MTYSKINTDTVIENLTNEGQSSRAFYMKLMSQHIEALEARLKEAEEVIKTGQALVLKMFEVYDDPQYKAAFYLLADHQGKYTGKQWTKEQDDFTDRAAAFLKGGDTI